jgi:hypothetical protein
MKGEGASSTSFWWRRWMEQSRSELVAHQLHLNVARLDHVFLQIHAVVAEGGLRLGAGIIPGFLKLVVAMDDAHAAPAAAGCGLDDDGVFYFVGDFLTLLHRVEQAHRARHHRHAGLNHGRFGRGLVTHLIYHLGRGTDEFDAILGADARKLRVFAQKAVAGVDGVGVGNLGRRDERRDVEVALAAGGRPDAHRLVGKAHVQAFLVGGRIHGHRFDAHFAASTDNAQGNFAPVGNQDFIKHGLLRSLDVRA